MKTTTVTLKARFVTSALLALMSITVVKAQLGNLNHVQVRTPENKESVKTGDKGGIMPMAPSGSIMVNENSAYAAYTPSELVQNLLVKGCLLASDVTFSGH